MKNKNTDILSAREQRANKIAFFLNEHNTVVSFHANIPGDDKQTKEAYFIVRYYANLFLPDICHEAMFYDSQDGPYVIMIFDNEDPAFLKETAMFLEEQDELGRLIDIDVHTAKKTYHRNEMRKCLVCGKPSHECTRNETHSKKDILAIIEQITEKALNKIIFRLIDYAMTLELDLEPKFGLVTKNTTGSHKDMDYFLMLKAKNAIIPYLVEIFITSFKSLSKESIFSNARLIGQNAELAMSKTTDNINAYKGLIFSLGLILASCGYELGRTSNIDDIFAFVKYMAKDITSELKQDTDTFGKNAYNAFGFTGARGEAESGYVNVQKAMAIMSDFSADSLLRTLIFLISSIEDTVFLKRSGSLQKYEKFKAVFSELSDFSHASLNQITDLCIKNDLSFGGSADLLVVAVFMKRFQRTFYGIFELK